MTDVSNAAVLTYDRGTLTLAGAVPGSMAPYFTVDPRTRCRRAPAYRYAELLRAAATDSEARVQDLVSNGFPQAPGGWSDISLRHYQRDALWAWTKAAMRGLISLPTGAGKTRTAIAAIAGAGTSALVLVPTRVLLDQWLKAIREYYGGPLGRLGDGSRTVAPITVATYASAWHHAWWIGGRFGLVVVDEVHHFGRGERDELLEMMVAPRRLGLSATVPTDGAHVVRLTELVGPQVFECRLDDLAGTYLANFELRRLSQPLSADERRDYEAYYDAFRDYYRTFVRQHAGADWSELRAAAMLTPEGRHAMDCLFRAKRLLALTEGKVITLTRLLSRHSNDRVLVFTADVAAAMEVAKLFLLMPLIGAVSAEERTAVLNDFASGHLRTLVSCQVLNEGFDLPDANVAIVLGGRGGAREHMQRIGRILRPSPGKRALLYELVAGDTLEVQQSRRRGGSLEYRMRNNRSRAAGGQTSQAAIS